MNNCHSIFLLRDIKKILNSTDMKKLARASFQAYLKSDNDIVQCFAIDCKQVNLKEKKRCSFEKYFSLGLSKI